MGEGPTRLHRYRWRFESLYGSFVVPFVVLLSAILYVVVAGLEGEERDSGLWLAVAVAGLLTLAAALVLWRARRSGRP